MAYSFHKKIISTAVANNYAYALCRLPGAQKVSMFIAFDQPSFQPVDVSGNRCFVFSPFNAGDKAFVLKPSLYYEDEQLLNAIKADQRQYGFLHATASLKQEVFYPSKNTVQHSDKAHYIQYVNELMGAIRRHECKKVVAARCMPVPLSSKFDLLKYFFTLCEEYNNALVYVYASPQSGTWIGATPEKLVTLENDTLQTVALAGTLEKNAKASWTDKEYEEHALVEDFISGVLSGSALGPYKKSPVQTVAAGHLRHLSSTFTLKQEAAQLQKDFTALLRELNPTPAVCGLPKYPAAAFIEEYEGMERRFYSGFTGVIGREATRLFVNLRCMELMKDQALLYAGAGITSDSVPEREWEETERKMQTLRNFL